MCTVPMRLLRLRQPLLPLTPSKTCVIMLGEGEAAASARSAAAGVVDQQPPQKYTRGTSSTAHSCALHQLRASVGGGGGFFRGYGCCGGMDRC